MPNGEGLVATSHSESDSIALTALIPQRLCNRRRIDLEGRPPGSLGATMKLAMMNPAEGHGELITDPAELSRLGEAEMVSIRGSSTADEAGL